MNASSGASASANQEGKEGSCEEPECVPEYPNAGATGAGGGAEAEAEDEEGSPRSLASAPVARFVDVVGGLRSASSFVARLRRARTVRNGPPSRETSADPSSRNLKTTTGSRSRGGRFRWGDGAGTPPRSPGAGAGSIGIAGATAVVAGAIAGAAGAVPKRFASAASRRRWRPVRASTTSAASFPSRKRYTTASRATGGAGRSGAGFAPASARARTTNRPRRRGGDARGAIATRPSPENARAGRTSPAAGRAFVVRGRRGRANAPAPRHATVADAGIAARARARAGRRESARRRDCAPLLVEDRPRDGRDSAPRGGPVVSSPRRANPTWPTRAGGFAPGWAKFRTSSLFGGAPGAARRR